MQRESKNYDYMRTSPRYHPVTLNNTLYAYITRVIIVV